MKNMNGFVPQALRSKVFRVLFCLLVGTVLLLVAQQEMVQAPTLRFAKFSLDKPVNKHGSESGSLTGSDGTINDREKRGISNGCVYNDNVYQEGAVWTDGCEAECKCLDGSTGRYECTELCPYVDVPSECHMEPPVAGNCCKLLSCPPGSKK